MGKVRKDVPLAQQYGIAASIVAYHTDPEELRELVRSLCASRLRVLVTVVDNSPTDGLREVVEREGGAYLFTGSNLGFGAANNLALKRSLKLAPYQAVINPDIVTGADTLERLRDFMDEHPEVGQVMPAIVHPDGLEQRLTKRLPTPVDLFLRRFLGGLGKRLAPKYWALYEMRDLDMSVVRDVPCLSGCFMFLRSSVLERVGLFDERFFMYMEDVDLCRRIGDVSRTVFHPRTCVVHGYAKGSYNNPRLFWYHIQSAVRYFTKWGWIRDEGRRQRNRCTAETRESAGAVLYKA